MTEAQRISAAMARISAAAPTVAELACALERARDRLRAAAFTIPRKNPEEQR